MILIDFEDLNIGKINKTMSDKRKKLNMFKCNYIATTYEIS